MYGGHGQEHARGQSPAPWIRLLPAGSLFLAEHAPMQQCLGTHPENSVYHHKASAATRRRLRLPEPSASDSCDVRGPVRSPSPNLAKFQELALRCEEDAHESMSPSEMDWRSQASTTMQMESVDLFVQSASELAVEALKLGRTTEARKIIRLADSLYESCGVPSMVSDNHASSSLSSERLARTVAATRSHQVRSASPNLAKFQELVLQCEEEDEHDSVSPWGKESAGGLWAPVSSSHSNALSSSRSSRVARQLPSQVPRFRSAAPALTGHRAAAASALTDTQQLPSNPALPVVNVYGNAFFGPSHGAGAVPAHTPPLAPLHPPLQQASGRASNVRSSTESSLETSNAMPVSIADLPLHTQARIILGTECSQDACFASAPVARPHTAATYAGIDATYAAARPHAPLFYKPRQDASEVAAVAAIAAFKSPSCLLSDLSLGARVDVLAPHAAHHSQAAHKTQLSTLAPRAAPDAWHASSSRHGSKSYSSSYAANMLPSATNMLSEPAAYGNSYAAHMLPGSSFATNMLEGSSSATSMLLGGGVGGGAAAPASARRRELSMQSLEDTWGLKTLIKMAASRRQPGDEEQERAASASAAPHDVMSDLEDFVRSSIAEHAAEAHSSHVGKRDDAAQTRAQQVVSAGHVVSLDVHLEDVLQDFNPSYEVERDKRMNTGQKACKSLNVGDGRHLLDLLVARPDSGCSRLSAATTCCRHLRPLKQHQSLLSSTLNSQESTEDLDSFLEQDTAVSSSESESEPESVEEDGEEDEDEEHEHEEVEVEDEEEEGEASGEVSRERRSTRPSVALLQQQQQQQQQQLDDTLAAQRWRSEKMLRSAMRCCLARRALAKARTHAAVIANSRRHAAALVLQAMYYRQCAVALAAQNRARGRAAEILLGFARFVAARSAAKVARAARANSRDSACRSRNASCAVIQRGVRVWFARRRVLPALRAAREHRAANVVQLRCRMHAARKRMREVKYAAIVGRRVATLQAAWRMHAAKSHMRALRYAAEMLLGVVATLQAAWRTHAARRSQRQQRERRQEEEAERERMRARIEIERITSELGSLLHSVRTTLPSLTALASLPSPSLNSPTSPPLRGQAQEVLEKVREVCGGGQTVGRKCGKRGEGRGEKSAARGGGEEEEESSCMEGEGEDRRREAAALRVQRVARGHAARRHVSSLLAACARDELAFCQRLIECREELREEEAEELEGREGAWRRGSGVCVVDDTCVRVDTHTHTTHAAADKLSTGEDVTPDLPAAELHRLEAIRAQMRSMTAELQQSCNRAATELQHASRSHRAVLSRSLALPLDASDLDAASTELLQQPQHAVAEPQLASCARAPQQERGSAAGEGDSLEMSVEGVYKDLCELSNRLQSPWRLDADSMYEYSELSTAGDELVSRQQEASLRQQHQHAAVFATAGDVLASSRQQQTRRCLATAGDVRAARSQHQHAAVLLQAVAKGHLARNSVRLHLRTLAAVRLGRTYRGHLARNAFSKITAAAAAARLPPPPPPPAAGAAAPKKASAFQGLRVRAAQAAAGNRIDGSRLPLELPGAASASPERSSSAAAQRRTWAVALSDCHDIRPGLQSLPHTHTHTHEASHGCQEVATVALVREGISVDDQVEHMFSNGQTAALRSSVNYCSMGSLSPSKAKEAKARVFASSKLARASLRGSR